MQKPDSRQSAPRPGAALRPWLAVIGSIGMGGGIGLLWVSPAGWAVLGLGTACVLISLLAVGLWNAPRERVRVAICLGFILLAAALVRSMAMAIDEGNVGRVVITGIGGVAGISVGAGGLTNAWATRRLATGGDGRMTRFFARHWNAPI